MPRLSDKIVILGCGCFGASTAYHLLQRGYTNITILDKSSILPAPDAASNDINRIVRSSYNDRFYTELARDAIAQWKDKAHWDDAYHESGVIILGLPPLTSPTSESGSPIELGGTEIPTGNNSDGIPYAEAAFINDRELGARVYQLRRSSIAEDKDIDLGYGFSASVKEILSSVLTHRFGYLNQDGGWADAGKGLRLMIEKVSNLGGVIVPGKEATRIEVEDGKCKGVLCSDGSRYDADEVVIATGSWSASAFRDLNLQNAFQATGQCTAMIHLSPEEAKRYKDCPVILDFDTGFYVFPPNENDIIKMAIHSPGYTNTTDKISTPRTVVSNPSDGLRIPQQDVINLKHGLTSVYPELGKKEFTATRLCWYNDSADGDWIISRYPAVEGLVLATAGCGHAYKFLPVIGRLTADLLENKLEASIVAKLSYGRSVEHKDNSRSGKPLELDVETLWAPPPR